jgi:hypothetical protein
MHRLETIFSERQREAIHSKIWWVADRERPFLMKFALDEDFILLGTHGDTQN